MFILNIDEGVYYETFDIYCYAENVINRLFRDYFAERYKAHAVNSRMVEIEEELSMKIPEEVVFIVKDDKLYYLTQELQFTLAPKDFFEINENAHHILIECFETCYTRFKDLITNYKEWSGKYSISLIANVKRGTKFGVEDLEESIEKVEEKFEDILEISLGETFRKRTFSELKKVYEENLLENNPVMIITKTQGDIQKMYTVTDELTIKEVSYSLIERELEEIINRVIPVDTDFLVNRIYNYMMLPLKEVKPYIRINKVQEYGVNATLFLKDNDIPVVARFIEDINTWYAFLPVRHNASDVSWSKRVRHFTDTKVKIIVLNPSIGIDKMQKVNETMFKDIDCYVEILGDEYQLREKGVYGSSTTSFFNRIYRLKNGKCIEIINDSYGHEIEKDSNVHKKLLDESQKAFKEGSYGFFKIEL